jgi:hypothetical protein
LATEVGRLFWRCDKGCDTFGVKEGEPCLSCPDGFITKLATHEEYVEALERAEEADRQAEEEAIDLVTILNTFKKALEEHEARIAFLEKAEERRSDWDELSLNHEND